MRRIIISEYDDTWPDAFVELSGALRTHLGSLVAEVEHVGSTAVPSLAAKSIINLDIVIKSSRLLPQVIDRLHEIGYLHEGGLGISSREAFKRIGADVPRLGSDRTWPEHHLYACPESSAELRRHVQFRDYLRAHPEEMTVYASLKRRLAEECGEDREAYTEGKTRFVEEILARIADEAWTCAG